MIVNAPTVRKFELRSEPNDLTMIRFAGDDGEWEPWEPFDRTKHADVHAFLTAPTASGVTRENLRKISQRFDEAARMPDDEACRAHLNDDQLWRDVGRIFGWDEEEAGE